MPRLRWLLAAAALALFIAFPTAAHATLAFVRKPLHPQVWVAEDNGKHARRLLAGSNPHVSPDGQIVALMRGGIVSAGPPELVLAPADRSAPPSVLAKGWHDPYVFAWSPDSKTVAAILGPDIGKQRLVLIDTVTGAQNVVAQGYFNGVSFDPAGTGIVYGRAGAESYPPRSDVYRFDVPQGPSVRYAPPVRLTRDQRSISPVWGPGGEIVFAKLLGAQKRRYGPKNELYLMSTAGKQVRQLTHSKVSPLAVGLTPTAWSPSGNRLLAQFGGQDLTYAVAVNPKTGAQRPLVEATEQGFVGAAFTADGSHVLGTDGGFEWGAGTNVATVPYPHGKPKVLAKNAFEPSRGG